MSTTTERPTDPHAAAAPLRKTPRPAASIVEPGDDAERLPPPSAGDAATPVRPPRLPWILAILGLVGTLAFGLAWLNARDGGSGAASSSDRSAELLKAAKDFSKDLTNFDGATIDRDFDRITARATGDFRSQADQFFSSDVRSQLKKAQASSRGEVRSAYVQTVDGDRGTVFVVVDQTIANNASPQPQADTLRMELGLVRRDGTWKVERVSVLTAPSGGATGATTEKPSGSGSGSGN
jgi:hypothetical protein